MNIKYQIQDNGFFWRGKGERNTKRSRKEKPGDFIVSVCYFSKKQRTCSKE